MGGWLRVTYDWVWVDGSEVRVTGCGWMAQRHIWVVTSVLCVCDVIFVVGGVLCVVVVYSIL